MHAPAQSGAFTILFVRTFRIHDSEIDDVILCVLIVIRHQRIHRYVDFNPRMWVSVDSLRRI